MSSLPKNLSDLRSTERVQLRAPAILHDASGARTGELRDLSCAGAFVASSPVGVQEGSGVRLEFTLPLGFAVSTFATVRWVRDVPSHQGPIGFGVQFFGLDGVNREFINYYLRSSSERPVTDAPVMVKDRFIVKDEGRNRMLIRMLGSLTPVESEALLACINDQLAKNNPTELFAYIDVRELGACCKATLDPMRTWLKHLGERRHFAALLVGPESIGAVQMRRLAREAGVADSVLAFTDELEANKFWQSLERDFAAMRS